MIQPTRHRLARLAALIAVCCILPLDLAACNNSSAPQYTDSTATVTVTAEESIGLSKADKDAILKQYNAIWQVEKEAISMHGEQRMAYVSNVATGGMINKLITVATGYQQENIQLQGAPTTNPRILQYTDKQAIIFDCQNASTFKKFNTKTGVITDGPEKDPTYAELEKGKDGIWRVAYLETNEEACA